jgi:predicted DNA-binding antitoxin AbrB/MazE fold protein
MRLQCRAHPFSIHVYWLWVERGGTVSKIIKGKYKNGVFEPLEPVDLRENETVEIVVPEKAPDDGAAFLSSFGTWKDIVPESFIEEVYERRVRGSRPPIEL